VGGERNWDYRYTWIRDGSFSVFALLGLGFSDEAAGLGKWIRDRVEERAGGEDSPLAIMYRVDSSSDLEEFTLDHFEGYKGSSPVRIGDGAAGQLQLDIYGEAIDSIYRFDHMTPVVADRGWNDLTRSTGSASTGTSPTRASGRPGAAGARSCSAGASPG